MILAKRIPLIQLSQDFLKSALDNSAAGVETARKILELVTRFVKTANPATCFRRTARVSTLQKLQRCRRAGTLYYTRQNHPCADIFFKDDTGALYLVGVGGTGNISKALKKVRKMNDVLVKEGLREDLQVSELKGVVLLPNFVNIRLENEESLSEAITVIGAKARMLLGGLAQLVAWLPTV